MAKEQKEDISEKLIKPKTEIKKVAVKAEKKEKQKKDTVPTVASTVKKLGTKGAKNKLTFVKNILDDLKSQGIVNNIRGTPLTEDIVLAQVNAIFRDIKNGTGPKAWKQYTLINNETEVSVKLKK